MQFILIRGQRQAWQQARVIDVTPGARWKSALRSTALGIFLLVLVPLVWLVAGVVALALLGAGALVLAAFTARWWWLAHRMGRVPQG